MDWIKLFGYAILFLIPLVMIIINFTVYQNLLLLIIGFSWIGVGLFVLTIKD